MTERRWYLAGLGLIWTLWAGMAAATEVEVVGLFPNKADRGVKVSYYAVWHFFEHEGISFKKKPARQRAGSSRRGPAARAMEEIPGPA